MIVASNPAVIVLGPAQDCQQHFELLPLDFGHSNCPESDDSWVSRGGASTYFCGCTTHLTALWMLFTIHDSVEWHSEEKFRNKTKSKNFSMKNKQKKFAEENSTPSESSGCLIEIVIEARRRRNELRFRVHHSSHILFSFSFFIFGLICLVDFQIIQKTSINVIREWLCSAQKVYLCIAAGKRTFSYWMGEIGRVKNMNNWRRRKKRVLKLFIFKFNKMNWIKIIFCFPKFYRYRNQ